MFAVGHSKVLTLHVLRAASLVNVTACYLPALLRVAPLRHLRVALFRPTHTFAALFCIDLIPGGL